MSSAQAPPKAQGIWCPRCQSRKVVEGKLGEAARFYPSRGFFKSLLGKPVFLSEKANFACLRCGLTWGEVDASELQSNIQEYGLDPHTTAVMRVVDGERTMPIQARSPDARPPPNKGE